ncbi:MAG: hypothetical protein ACYCOO_05035 [Chitinophagaceae bacterium]
MMEPAHPGKIPEFFSPFGMLVGRIFYREIQFVANVKEKQGMPRKKNKSAGNPRSFVLQVRIPAPLWEALHREKAQGSTLSARVRLILAQSLPSPNKKEQVNLEEVMETLSGIYHELQVTRMAIFPVVRYFRDPGSSPPIFPVLRALEQFQQTNAQIDLLFSILQPLTQSWWSTCIPEKASEES